MYFSAKHIDIKLNQDYTNFSTGGDFKKIVVCDGIGEFKDSGNYSKIVVDQIIKKNFNSISKLIANNTDLADIKLKYKGGTTIIAAFNKKNSNNVRIEYLGNGGILHLFGDFANNPNSNLAYRYAELMLPHISPSGALTKHISHNSGKEELTPSTVELNLINRLGDILLFFTDGISSLEEKVILKDNEGRFWRHESSAVQFILQELHSFLESTVIEGFQERLTDFNTAVLSKLKAQDQLEDDAALGIIITGKVIEYYKSRKNV